jgi:hypothetical protein
MGHPRNAEADCGGVQTATAEHWRKPYRPPVAVGDSTMLLALPQLAAAGFDVNAHGCRQFSEALTLLAGLAHAHLLPHLVVIALGADGSITSADIAETLRILGRDRELVLVTPRELGGGSGSDAATVRASARERPRQIHVLDWVHESEGHPAWFQPDGLHLTFAGADAFTRSLRQALRYAPPTPSPLVCPRASDPPGARLAPASPLVRTQGTTGVLRIDASRGTTTLALVNENAFAVSGLARLYPAVRLGGGAPSDQLLANACIELAGGASGALTLHLTPYGSERVALHRRLGVRLVLTLDAPGASAVKTSGGAYVLERAPRR